LIAHLGGGVMGQPVDDKSTELKVLRDKAAKHASEAAARAASLNALSATLDGLLQNLGALTQAYGEKYPDLLEKWLGQRDVIQELGKKFEHNATERQTLTDSICPLWRNVATLEATVDDARSKMQPQEKAKVQTTVYLDLVNAQRDAWEHNADLVQARLDHCADLIDQVRQAVVDEPRVAFYLFYFELRPQHQALCPVRKRGDQGVDYKDNHAPDELCSPSGNVGSKSVSQSASTSDSTSTSNSTSLSSSTSLSTSLSTIGLSSNSTSAPSAPEDPPVDYLKAPLLVSKEDYGTYLYDVCREQVAASERNAMALADFQIHPDDYASLLTRAQIASDSRNDDILACLRKHFLCTKNQPAPDQGTNKN
jgi:hypothetical protein